MLTQFRKTRRSKCDRECRCTGVEVLKLWTCLGRNGGNRYLLIATAVRKVEI